MPSITSSFQAFHQLRHLGHLEVEEFWVMALHCNQKLIAKERLFKGTVDSCPMHARDVFRSACRWNATNIIVAHNHPSGDPLPSQQDYHVTEELNRIGLILEIPLLDHLILAGSKYWSFADHGFKFQSKISRPSSW